MRPEIAWGLVAGMALTNILLRGAPIAWLSRVKLPAAVERWLGYVPVSVMAAIVATEVVRPGGAFIAPWGNPYLFAAVPTALVYRWTNSFLGATVTGIVSFLAFRYLLG